MQESKLLGTLIPSSPDFLPIVNEMRRKYQLPEVSPDDDPITEVFLDGEPVALEDFRKQIKNLVEDTTDHLPPDMSKIFTQARTFLGKPLDAPWLDLIPEKDREAIKEFYKLTQSMGEFIVNILDQFDSGIANMLYVYLLTGETDELPKDWISKVFPMSSGGERMIIAMASQVVDPEYIVQEFRKQCAKEFTIHHPKVTPLMVSTAYYMRLQRQAKPWNHIVEEYIERNHIQLPMQRNSQRYAEIWRRCEQRLKKRMQRCETVLSLLVEDKKTTKNVP